MLNFAKRCFSTKPQFKLTEQTMRDGIQGLKHTLDHTTKTELINDIYNAGINNIEFGSHVNLPQMKNSIELFKDLVHTSDSK